MFSFNFWRKSPEITPTVMVEASRGIHAGPDAAHLTEYQQRGLGGESYADPVAARTGSVEVLTRGTWSDNARVFVRQTDPLPLTILAAIPSGIVGG